MQHKTKSTDFKEGAEQTNKIFELTATIQKEFPELYIHLDETPLFLSGREKRITRLDFEQYLESLKMQLATFERPRLKHPEKKSHYFLKNKVKGINITPASACEQ